MVSRSFQYQVLNSSSNFSTAPAGTSGQAEENSGSRFPLELLLFFEKIRYAMDET